MAIAIIERIRALSGKRPLEFHPLDLNEIAADILRLVSADARRRGITLQSELTYPLPMVKADKVCLQQVILNLIVNAMDAMTATPTGRRHITISSELSGTDVVVAVHDSGPGLPADLLGKLFTPFVTTKSNGVGIGLAIARTIVEAHGGTIGARNSPVGGAIFTLTLPATDAHEIQSSKLEFVGSSNESSNA